MKPITSPIEEMYKRRKDSRHHLREEGVITLTGTGSPKAIVCAFIFATSVGARGGGKPFNRGLQGAICRKGHLMVILNAYW